MLFPRWQFTAPQIGQTQNFIVGFIPRMKSDSPICISKVVKHDDVIKWKHFPRRWPFVRGIQRSPVNSPHKEPVARIFDTFFDLRLNKRLSKQTWGWWVETPLHPLWHHCNENAIRCLCPPCTYSVSVNASQSEMNCFTNCKTHCHIHLQEQH